MSEGCWAPRPREGRTVRKTCPTFCPHLLCLDISCLHVSCCPSPSLWPHSPLTPFARTPNPPSFTTAEGGWGEELNLLMQRACTHSSLCPLEMLLPVR